MSADKQFNILTQLSLNSDDFKAGMNRAKQNVKDLAVGTKGATGNLNELQRALSILKNTSFAGKSKQEIDAIKGRIKGLKTEISTLNKETSASGGFGSSITNMLGPLKGLVPALGIGVVVSGLKSIKDSAIEVRTEFSKYEAVLSNTLGSQSEANKAFSELQQFAATTPFQLNELTGSYVKLVNQGFKPTMDEMTSLGDLAASMGKSFDQLTEAIIDAQVGENERLKQFGIRAQKDGDKIRYTFKGITTEVDNNAESIRKYLLSLGDLQGVQGGMEKISKTIGGAISNSADASDKLFNAIGKRLEPAMVEMLGTWTKLKNDLADGLQTATEKFEKQKTSVLNLQNNLVPLVEEYEKLQSKTSLSSDEQERIKTLISQIAEIAPAAITKWDEYGNAIGISTEKAKEFIKTQQALLKYQNQSAIEEQEKQLDKLQKKFDETKSKLESGLKEIYIQTDLFGGGKYITEALTPEDIDKLNSELKEYGLNIQNIETLLGGLKGDYLNIETGTGGTGVGSGGSGGTGVGTTKKAGPFKQLTTEASEFEDKIKDILSTGGVITPEMLKVLEDYRSKIENINTQLKEVKTNAFFLQEPEPDFKPLQSKEASFTPEIDTKQLVSMTDFVKQNLNDVDEMLKQQQETMNLYVNTFMNGFSQIGSAIVDSFGLARDGFEGFLSVMLKGVAEIIAMLISNAIAAAISAGTQSAAATGPLAVFTLPAFIATAVGTVLAAVAAIPKFETGGIVPGSSYTGDNVPVMVNSGEMILNKSQQANLFKMINRGAGGFGGEVEFRIKGTELIGVINNTNRKNNSIK